MKHGVKRQPPAPPTTPGSLPAGAPAAAVPPSLPHRAHRAGVIRASPQRGHDGGGPGCLGGALEGWRGPGAALPRREGVSRWARLGSRRELSTIECNWGPGGWGFTISGVVFSGARCLVLLAALGLVCCTSISWHACASPLLANQGRWHAVTSTPHTHSDTGTHAYTHTTHTEAHKNTHTKTHTNSQTHIQTHKTTHMQRPSSATCGTAATWRVCCRPALLSVPSAQAGCPQRG